MYLENSEQTKKSGEGELAADVILVEQCSVPKATEVAGLKENANLDLKVLVEYTEQIISGEMDALPLCKKHDSFNPEEKETCTCYDIQTGSMGQCSTSDGFLDSDETFQDLEDEGLSRPLDKCIQHCECFKLCESPEHCANHSLGSESTPCCGHCPEHLELFQQCQPSDQQSESSDFEPDEMKVDSDSLGERRTSDSILDFSDDLEFLQQYEPLGQNLEPSDSEQDPEDLEQSFTHNVSDSVDSLDEVAELCEYEEVQVQSEYTDDDVEEDETHELEQNEMELSEEEDVLEPVDFDVQFLNNTEETHMYMEEASQISTVDDATDGGETCGNDNSEYEATEQCDFNNCTEEDGSSECSSVENKSFNTCPDDSFPSDRCSDSSEESDKGIHEDSSDEQMQWESFEEDGEEPTRESNEENNKKEKRKTPDVLMEVYFDLFDKADTSGLMFAQKPRYISCFDDGDIHDHLFLEESQRLNLKKSQIENDEKHVEETIGHCDGVIEDSEEEDFSHRVESRISETQSEDWTVKSETGSIECEVDENESEVFLGFFEHIEETEDEVEDDDACSFDDHVSDDGIEESDIYLHVVDKDGPLAPYFGKILAYDEVSLCESDESLDDDETQDETEQSEDDVSFLACSETEPYWALVDEEESGDFYKENVEDYYAYQIKTIQSTWTTALTKFMLDKKSSYHQIKRKASKKNKNCKALHEENYSFKIVDADCTDVERIPCEQNAESDDEDSELKDISKDKRPLVDIIHSVVQKHETTQSRDSEEEQSDDESCERCDCEHCIPPAEQIPTEPLLPKLELNNEGKICVVIDLDETLVHSSFKPVNNPDFIIPVEIEGTHLQVYVLKRPYVDEFLKRMGELFECVLFTASLSKYADPVSDLLDECGAFSSRLFREACVFHKGNYVKDLSRLGRDLNKVIILDNSPASYIFHPENAVPVGSWFDDKSDTELLDLLPLFERLSKADDVYDVLKKTSS